MRRLQVAAAVAVLGVSGFAVSGCGGGESASPPGTTGPAPTTPTTISTEGTTTASRLALGVYFLREGKIAAARRLVPATRAVGSAALDALVGGPTTDERAAGLKTALPASTRFSGLRIDDGVAKLTVPKDLSRSAIAQVVFTLTQFPAIRGVEIDARRLARGDFEDITPQILVEAPTVGQEIASPVRIHGTANTFEATFIVRLLLNAAGQRAFEHFVTATSGSGTRGTFDVTIPFTVRSAGPATLVVFEESAANGRPLHVVEIPVLVRPG